MEPAPESAILRPAVASDYEAFVALHEQLDTGDPAPPPERFTGELLPTTIIAERAGRAVGYTWFEILEGMGYVRHVVVDAESRGLKLGRALMLAVRDRLSAAGASEWCLNVKPDNVPARTLYESLGLRAAYESAALRFSWSLAGELPLGDPLDIVIGPDASWDRDLESALGVAPGLLAGARRQAGRVIVAARREGRPVVAAVFHPAFPGSFPFRLAEASDARRVLEAMRPFALPDKPDMGVVVEDAPALLSLLVSHGAEVRLRMIHHRGPLPR